MNWVRLKGYIRNIRFSHKINDVEYYKAEVITKDDKNRENIINICFKRFSNNFNENDEIDIVGNIRTFSHKEKDKNKVDVFVFTYFDKPEEDLLGTTTGNSVIIDGRICKKNELRKTQDGKDVLDFIIANNICVGETYLNAYIPVCAWGKSAKAIDKMNIGDILNIEGSLISRQYKKKISENDFEIRIAHEINLIRYAVEK